MLQVKSELEQQLERLNAGVSALIKWRDETVRYHEREIENVNREFDKSLYSFHQNIEHLKVQMGPAPAPHSPRNRKPIELVGLTPGEQAHFQELRAKSNAI